MVGDNQIYESKVVIEAESREVLHMLNTSEGEGAERGEPHTCYTQVRVTCEGG